MMSLPVVQDNLQAPVLHHRPGHVLVYGPAQVHPLGAQGGCRPVEGATTLPCTVRAIRRWLDPRHPKSPQLKVSSCTARLNPVLATGATGPSGVTG